MKNNMKTALSQDKFAALRLAELQMTDSEDFDSCVADMQRTASLNTNEAVEVAKAIRAKYLPGLAREAGFTEDVASKFLNLEDGHETADFANETHKEEDEDWSDDDTEDLTDDMDEMDDDDSEVEDDDIATFEIEVPAEMVDAAQKAVQEALDKVLGGNDSDDEVTHFNDDDSEDEEMEDDSEEHQMHKSSRREKTMTRQALAARRAEREQILRRTERQNILNKFASEEGEVSSPASAGFQHSDKNQYHGEMEYPTMKFTGHTKLDGQEAIDEQDITFPKGKVPTKNPNYLQLGDSIEASRFEGSEDGSYDYELDLPVLGDIPSNNEADLDNFQVPTDADLPARKTTVASKKCECCGKNAAKVASMGMKVHTAKCEDCNNKLSVCDDCMKKDAACPNCKTAEKKEEDEREAASATPNLAPVEKAVVETAQEGMDSTTKQFTEQATASVSNARIKAAYSCATKLALAGIINSDECDAYADQLLEDGLRADVMIKNTQLLLRSAQASAERVAAAAAQKLNTRTASAMSISTSPALSGSANSAALDIQSALKGTWTMPKIED
jgi:ribosome-binding protein aMBF1 (putative translation factor)